MGGAHYSRECGVTGSWLALGLAGGAGVWAHPAAILFALSLGIGLVLFIVTDGSNVRRILVTLVAGVLFGVVRFTLFPPEPKGSFTVGIVQVVQEGVDGGTEFVALREDGRLVGLQGDSIEVAAGERIRWRGDFDPRTRWVAGMRVNGVYRVNEGDVEPDAEWMVLKWPRSWLRETVLASIPEPSGSLALGVLIGDDRRLPVQVRRVMREAGLAHITAVSGWNVAVVAGLTEAAVRPIGIRRGRLLLVVLSAIWSYALLTGLEPPVQRAAVMTSILYLARWRGWPREAISALGWSVVGLLTVQPQLAFSLAFQLSVLATAALSVAPVLFGRSHWRDVILYPLVVQLAVIPLLVTRFASYSLVAPLANMLVEPVIPWFLGATLLVMPAGVWSDLGTVLGIPAWLIGKWIVLVAERLTNLPGATGLIIGPPLEVVVAGYILIGVGVLAWIDRGRKLT